MKTVNNNQQMSKVFKQHKLLWISGVLPFIWHHIKAVEKGVSFIGPPVIDNAKKRYTR